MIDEILYRLAWRFQWTLAPIIYRFRCPHPIIADHSVHACIASDNCGCDNLPKWKTSAP